jgi:hypothetical protein
MRTSQGFAQSPATVMDVFLFDFASLESDKTDALSALPTRLHNFCITRLWTGCTQLIEKKLVAHKFC